MMSVRRLVLPVLAAVAAVLLVTTPAAALPSFGTAPVSGGGSASTPSSGPAVGVSSVSVGHHSGFDRVVFTFRSRTPHFEVSYVSGVTQDASGAPVPLLGSAFLSVVLRGTNAGSSVQPTITPGFPMLKQIKGAGDFEGVTSYGIGAASKSGFRAFTLTGPNRLVIDLAIPASGTGASGGGLAQTGVSHTVPLAIAGLGLIGLGGAGLWLARRRYAT
jgi:LPXTG-motif cell wall-anchored protein